MLGGMATGLSPLFAHSQPSVSTSLSPSALDTIRGDVPGMAARLFDRERTLYHGVSGVRAKGEAAPVEQGDCWHIGSCTKAMTAAVFGLLVQDGLLDFDAPVRALFPDIKAVHPEWQTRTAADVMAHVAGIGNGAPMGTLFFLTARGSKDPLPVQRRKLAEFVLARPPAHPRGTFEYANMNYVLIGAAIEIATKTAWEDVMRSRLFAPLGMASSGFGPPPAPNPQGHAKSPFSKQATPVGFDAMADNPLALGPAGTIHLSLEDWMAFCRLFLGPPGENKGPFHAETLARLAAPHATRDATSQSALGWIVAEMPWTNGPALIHAGSNTLWLAQARLAPARGIGMLTAANGPYAVSAPVLADFERAIIASL